MTIKQQIKNRFLGQSVVLDTESTGLDPKQAEICEIGSTFTVVGKPQIQGALFGTHEPIPFMASSKNNISRAMLESLPKLEDNIEKAIELLDLGNDDIKYLIAHNYNYDRTILEHNFKRVGQPELAELILEKKWICTYRLAQHLFKTEDYPDISYMLSYLRYAFDLPVGDVAFHRAGDDSKVAWLLLNYICNHVLDNVIPQEEITLDFDLGDYLYNVGKSTIKITTMPFGKHKGEKIADIPMSYWNWMLEKSDILNETSDNFDPDFAATVEEELNRRMGN